MRPSNEQKSSLSNFTVLEKLGEGSFASVYKVIRNDDNKLYAMKKVRIIQMKERQRDNALNQVRILASISHPNVVNYKQAFFDDQTQSLCIVMELADDGDIQKKVKKHIDNHSYFTETEIWQALIQMARGLKVLHQINILHRDLKCANVFCTKELEYKLGDLNVSKVAKRGMARTQTGTPFYTSPQVWKDRPYDSKCDIWSLGCVVYEMAALHPPFKARDLKELYAKVQRGIYQRIPVFYSDDLEQIINCCLKVNPASRLSAAQLLEHPKVLANTPRSEKFVVERGPAKKTDLISTILCPRNLKSLKSALPGAQYEGSPHKPKSVDSSSRRALSCRSQKNQLPRIIDSPKAIQPRKNQMNYGLLRKPSSEKYMLPAVRKQPQAQIKSRQPSARQLMQNNQKIARHNSVDSVRKRCDSSSRVLDNPRRQLSRERKADKSRERINSSEVEDISNRCRNIQERVKALILPNRSPRVQKVPVSYEKRYNLPTNSRQKRDHSSRSRNNSRNNSMEIRKLIELQVGDRHAVARDRRPVIAQPKALPRNRSSERIQRQDSRKRFPLGMLPPRK